MCACMCVCRGNVIVWDDGTLGQSLEVTLSHITQVTGSLIVIGSVALGRSTEDPCLQSLQGMEALQVGVRKAVLDG